MSRSRFLEVQSRKDFWLHNGLWCRVDPIILRRAYVGSWDVFSKSPPPYWYSLALWSHAWSSGYQHYKPPVRYELMLPGSSTVEHRQAPLGLYYSHGVIIGYGTISHTKRSSYSWGIPSSCFREKILWLISYLFMAANRYQIVWF